MFRAIIEGKGPLSQLENFQRGGEKSEAVEEGIEVRVAIMLRLK